MKQDGILKAPTSAHVMGLETVDAVTFVRTCVKERSLSTVMKELNDYVLHGTAEERRTAERALKHLGFL